MPYFLNCPRCNKDNKYTNLGQECKKCDGTGRDWREDYELEGYHSRYSLKIEDLKREGIIALKDSEGNLFVFTYQDSIPKYSIKQEIEEIRESLNLPPPISTIFCQHNWEDKPNSNYEYCTLCKKEREKKFHEELKSFKYNKELHDSKYYFPNRCYGCEFYVDSQGDSPKNGSELVYCNKGGVVATDTGCLEFKPDITAECGNCWNHNSPNCDILKEVNTIKNGNRTYCIYHVQKERTDEPLIYKSTLSEVEFSKKIIESEYPYDVEVRRKIFDLMESSGIRMVTKEEFSFNKRCLSCSFHQSLHDHDSYQKDYAKCNFFGIYLLNHTGGNPYGYDEKICDNYSPDNKDDVFAYPKVYIDVLSDERLQLNKSHFIQFYNMYCDIIDASTTNVIAHFDYKNRTPNFIQYNEVEECFDLFFYDNELAEKFYIKDGVYTQPEKEKTWSDVSDDELFSAVDKVGNTQRNHGVYEGDRFNNCERCSFVTRNSSYPNGSPTGLICSQKEIFITANGCCELFE